MGEISIPVVTFVLLYYKAYEDTIECIRSIQALEKNKCKVYLVVVDNNSNDGSYERLCEVMNKDPGIFFLHNSVNLGFARGNNVGILYAKESLNSDFVVALNTDTIISQRNFIDVIASSFNQEHYYVMGPKVIGYYKKEEIQSPIGTVEDNSINKDILKNMIHLAAWKTKTISLLRKIRPPKNIIAKGAFLGDKYNCICSGCCLVFSPLFLQEWDGFYNGTFLYREERILFYVLSRLNCKTMYCDELEVYHKGGASSDIEYNRDEYKKAISFYTNRLASMRQEKRIRKLDDSVLRKVLKADYE